MASPVLPRPASRSSSRSRGIQRSPNPARRDKVRQGKLIRSWTEEEESFLFRSRLQGQKLSYKHIANRLAKSELACRLHYHHMTVGRKGHGHRPEEFDEENLSENSDASSPSTLPPVGEAPGFESSQDQRDRPPVSQPNHPQLPSFQSFLRDTFHHQRSTSMPGPLAESPMQGGSRETQIHNSTRPTRTLSGTFFRDYAGPDTGMRPSFQDTATVVTSRPPPTLYRSTTEVPQPYARPQYQTSPYESRR